jgi:methionyl aminopeptidase
LKVDIGVAIDGFIADTAFSVDLSEAGEFADMIKLNEEILENATKAVKVGMEVRDIGEACQGVMENSGGKFAIIKSLSGHALGQNTIHAGLTISNYSNDNKMVLDDLAFAVEPFVTSGVGDIFEGKGGGIYILKDNGKVRDRDARKILEFIQEEYGTRPFCLRWLTKPEGVSECGGVGVSENKLKFVFGMLVKQGILYEYPILIEKSRKPVSQVENTFLIADGKVVCTTG